MKYPKSLSFSQSNNQLIVHGQGVLLFKTNESNIKSCSFYIYSQDRTTSLKVEFTRSSIKVFNMQTKEPYLDGKNNSGLSPLTGAYYWFSLDSQNQRFYAGVGEARLETAIYTYQFTTLEGNKLSLETLTTVELPEEITPLKLLRDPITKTVALLVKNTDDLTMMDIAKGTYLPSAYLTQINQTLYNCVSGKRFVLNDLDFPDFAKAIEYNIATPGLWCNKRLLEKATEFNKDKPNIKETYLRITLGQNNGESPGIPYVMEIWPVGHYSPVHNHGNSSAVIRVLHGTIHVSLFPFLCNSPTGVKPFAAADFKEGDITWISENLNQVHQLKNLEVNTKTCITIQCYMYDKHDTAHYDYFDYLDDTGKKEQYEPDSDMDFVQFKQTIREQWRNRPRKHCFNFA